MIIFQARRWMCQVAYRHWHEIRQTVRNAIVQRQEEPLEEALSMCGELPFNGSHLPEVKEGRILKVLVRRLMCNC